MRRARLLILPVLVAPLTLAGCLGLPPTVPAPQPSTSQPAPSQPVETEPAPSQPAPSEPAPSEPVETEDPSTPAGDGDFTISVDGEEITSEWVSGVTCSMTSGFGTISSDSSGDTDYFSLLLSEEDGQLTGSLGVLADGDTSLIGTGENATVTLDGDQISGSVEMTSNFQDNVTVEFSGTCSVL